MTRESTGSALPSYTTFITYLGAGTAEREVPLMRIYTRESFSEGTTKKVMAPGERRVP